MTYTTQQLQAMSDDEINQDLTALIAGEDWYKHGELSDCGSFFTIHNAIGEPYFLDVINYCNNPNDIMPLAFERSIGIEKSPLRQEWIVRTCEVNMSNKQFRCYIDTNPLRAIACLLLMMED